MKLMNFRWSAIYRIPEQACVQYTGCNSSMWCSVLWKSLHTWSICNLFFLFCLNLIYFINIALQQMKKHLSEWFLDCVYYSFFEIVQTLPASRPAHHTYLREGKRIHTPGIGRIVQRSVSVLGQTGLFHWESAIGRPLQIVGTVPFHAWGKMAGDTHKHTHTHTVGCRNIKGGCRIKL